VASRAVDVDVLTRKRVGGLRVMESRRPFPPISVVALGAGSVTELIPVRVRGRVARDAVRGQTEERSVKRTVLRLERPGSRLGDPFASVTRTTAGLGMSPFQDVAREVVLERSGIEAHEREVRSEVFLVTGRAVVVGDGGVEARVLDQTIGERRVAPQAECRLHPRLSQFVALRAVAEPLQVRMGRRQLARRDELCGGSRRARRQEA
jgi:hypothetical protein